MTIRTRLIVLLLIPVSGVLYLGGQGLWNWQSQVSELGRLREMTGLAVASSSLVHELQKERGMSAGFLASRGAKFGDVITGQRELSTARLAELEEVLASLDLTSYGEGLRSTIEKGMEDVQRLGEVREQVSAHEIALSGAVGYYTGLNTAFITIVEEMIGESTNAALAGQISSYSSFLRSKEHAGIERAVMSATFSADRFAPGMYRKLVEQVKSQKVHEANFLGLASAGDREFYSQTVQGSVVDEVERLRSIGFKDDARKNVLSDAMQLVGYGGLIHNFKNYVIRGTPEYRGKVEKQYQHLVKQFDVYNSMLPSDSSHKEAVATYRKALDAYADATRMVAQAIATGRDPRQIDASVKIDDGPALAALDHLRTTSGFGVEGPDAFAATTARIELLREVEIHLSDGLAANATALEGEAALARLKFALLTLLIAGITIAGGVYIIRSIMTALETMRATMGEIAAGDLTRPLDTSRGDELGDLAGSINCLVENLRAMLRSVVTQCTSLDAASDQLAHAATEMAHEINSMSTESSAVSENSAELSEHLDQLAQAAQATTSNIGSMSASVEEMSTNLADVTSRVGGVSQDVVTVSSAVEEMSTSANDVSMKASEAARKTESAVATANDAERAMNELAATAADATGMVQTIDDIAGQINLLALNATIEAASAGESGRGFAVVANEVKTLAGQTASATDDIRNRIQQIQQSTEATMEAMRGSYEVITSTGEISRQIDMAVGEQRQATSEIAETVARTAESASAIARAAEECSMGANETAQRSGELSAGASESAGSILQASEGAEEITRAIKHVSSGLCNVSEGAGKVEQSSVDLRELSAGLSEMVTRFRVD
ncbi:MAG: methyl-accepting chemotaxis protein [Myxococcota bacterium]|jgi:methyl-accepting chemotaxis protein|nr:methyl-accepting chemotaxis protein [Myxococcota bacterium]